MLTRLQSTWRAYAALDRRIWALAGVRAVNTMGLSLAMAFMAIYLVTARGETAQTYGLIYLAANLCQSFSQGWAGQLSDRVGRTSVMTSALWIRSVVLVGLGLQVVWDAPVVVIGATLVVSSTLRGGFEPVAYAMVADIAEPRDRVSAYGLQRMGTNLGWAIGPAMGGLLAQVIHYGWVFMFAAAALVAAGLVTSRLAEPPHTASPKPKGPRMSIGDALRSAAADRLFLLLLACSFLLALVHVQLFPTLSVYGKEMLELSKTDIGLVYTVNGLCVLLLQVPAVAFIDRAGTRAALLIGSALYVVGFGSLGLAEGWWGMAGAVMVVTMGEVVVAPAHQAVGAALGDRERMGRVFGLIGTATMLGVAFAPLGGGVLYDHLRTDPMAMWGAIAGVAVVMGLGYALLTRSPRARVDADETAGATV